MCIRDRFSLNERYGEIDRVKFAASSKGLGVYDFIPQSPTIKQNPPFIGFSLLDDKKAQSLDCFIFDSKGQVTLLHLTDIHGQLKPIYFRPPSENFGIGKYEGIPPHLVGKTFLDYFGIAPNTPLAYAHTMLDYVPLAREYGKLGGLDRTASLIKKIRAERGENKVLLLDGGDTWQGSGLSYLENGRDMVEASNLLGVDVMTGHWEFTFGEKIFLENLKIFNGDFVAQNISLTEEALFEGLEPADEDNHFQKPYVIKLING